VPINRMVLVLALAACLVGALAYRSCSDGNRLNVDPQAAKEIEKAKRR
jgi:hypothetical protein